ncbi:MAG: PAS-domain containing protein [Pseudomonadota bacterium]
MTGEAYTSISKRFSYTLIAIITFVLIVFAIAAVMINFSRTEHQLETTLSNSLKLAEVALRIPIWNVDYYSAQGFVDALLLDDQIAFASVVVDGAAIATNAREQFGENAFADLEKASGFMTGVVDIRHQDETIGTLQLAVSRAAIRDTIMINIIGTLLLTVLIIAAIALTSIMISRRYIAKPLAKLQHSASAIATGDLEATIDVGGRDEVGSLARNLDVMRQSIKELIQALQDANRQQIRKILDVCPAGLLVVDEESRLVFYNQSFRDMLGYKDEELSGFDTRRFWTDPEQRERINDLARDRGDQLINQEVSWQRKDGNPLDGLLSYTQIDDQGEQTSFSGGSRIAWFYDISELKRAEEARRQSEQRLVDAIETIGEGFCLYDKDSRLILFNQRYKDGFPGNADVIEEGTFFREIATAVAHSGKLNAAVGREDEWIEERVKAFREPPDEPTVNRRMDGRWMQVSERRTRDGGRVGVFTDVTELKQREEELARISDRLQLALSMEGVGIWDVDLANGDVWWSREYTLLMRQDPEAYQPTATTWEEHLHPDEAEATIAKVDAFLEGSEIVMRVPEHFVRGDGSDIWVESLMRVQRDAGGRAVRLSGLDVDITEQLERERQLADANRFIMESLRYASRIQSAMLPAEDAIGQSTGDHFLIWEPRDIVGGDFFWHHPMPGGYAVIVGDCTGHGVPGAFMTLIACGLLDRALESGVDRPSLVLAELHRNLQSLLGQDQADGETDDGLDAGICFVSDAERKLVFSGARFSLFHKHGGDFAEIRGDKKGIGYRRFAADTVFNDRVLDLNGADSFYMTTDGLIDQIGGERRRSFGKKRFLGCLADNADHPLPAQAETLKRMFDAYQGSEARRDDVTVLGFTPGIA